MVSKRAGQTGIVYLWIMVILLSKGQLCYCQNTKPTCTQIQVTQEMASPTAVAISWSPTNLPLDQLEVKITNQGNLAPIRARQNLIQNGAIFTDLPESTTLTATVCQTTTLSCCGDVSFTTGQSEGSQTNEVTQINACVFYPIRNNQEVVSAQVSWRVLNGTTNRQYQITVRCLSSTGRLELINNGMPFLPDPMVDSHINIMIFTNSLPVFPLPKDRECLIQLTANTGNFLSQSSQVYLHQFDTRVSEFTQALIKTDSAVSLWTPGQINPRSLLCSDQEPSLMPSNRELPKAIAFDSRRRKMFAVIEGSGDEEPAELLRYTIDNIDIPELIVKLPSPFEPMAMTYDWLSGVVYIAGLSEQHTKVLKVVIADDNSPQKEAEAIYMGDNDVKDIDPQMHINPFIGTLSWIEHTGSTTTVTIYNINCDTKTGCLSRLSLSSPVVVVQNESSNCLTIIDESGTPLFYQTIITMNKVVISTTTSCGINQSAISDESRITFDGNGGLYIAKSNVVKYTTRRSMIRNVSLSNDVNTLLSTNPGTQPYPDMIQCLAPTGLTVTASMVSSSSATVSWTAIRPMECEGVSTSQLVYLVRYQNGRSDTSQIFEEMLMETSKTISGLLSNTTYEVTVMVRSSFTMPGMYLRESTIQFMTSAEDTTAPSSTPSLATITPVNTVPPSDTSPPVNTTQPPPETSSTVQLVVGIGSAVGVMFLLVLIVLVVLGIGCGCFIYQKSKTGGGKDLESNLSLSQPSNQFQGGIHTSEEPVNRMSREASCDYKEAVSDPGKSNLNGVYTSLNTTSIDRHEYMTIPNSNTTNETEDNDYYSSVDATNMEKQYYIGSQQYTSLQSPVNSESHIYTPLLQHVPAADKMPTYQEKTFTLENSRGTSNVVHTEEEEKTNQQETGNEKQDGSKPQEEPLYF